MQYHLKLTQEDYINNFLFAVSSKKQQKKRNIMTGIFVACFLVIAAGYFMEGDTIGAGLFIVIAILILTFFGLYMKWRYRKLYSNYVKINYQYLIGQPGTVELTELYLITTNQTGEGKIKLSALKNITETDKYYFFRTVINSTINIPKIQLSDGEFDKKLKEIAAQYQIPFIQDFNWRF